MFTPDANYNGVYECIEYIEYDQIYTSIININCVITQPSRKRILRGDTANLRIIPKPITVKVLFLTANHMPWARLFPPVTTVTFLISSCLFLFHRFMFCFVCFIFNSKVTEKKIGCAILLENSRHLKGLVQEKKKSIRVRKKLLCRTGTKRESTRVGHGHAWSRLAIRAANPPILQAQKWLTAHTFRTNFSS